ncbi:MAG: hypothetical protein MI974_00540 [Chitinophagales bacterium]|nr:hypothetical protein [Chitinophagales bacterium]
MAQKKITIKRVINAIQRRTLDKVLQSLANKRIDAYIRDNNLQPVIDQARQATNSTGADLSDYVLLHAYIRQAKLQYILECGTGLTTWIMADALMKNHENSEKSDASGLIISMEEDKSWHQHAIKVLPEKYTQYVRMVHSSRRYVNYTFIFGVAYENIPDYPYDMMFIDGPVCRYFPNEFTSGNKENFQHTAAMDLILLLLERDLRITAFIDNLKRTQIAYSCLFEPGKLKTYKYWSNIGILESVQKKDLIINSGHYLSIYHKVIKEYQGIKIPSFSR